MIPRKISPDDCYNISPLPLPINGSTDPSRQESFPGMGWSNYCTSNAPAAPGAFFYGHERAGNVLSSGCPAPVLETGPHGSGIAPRLNAGTGSYPAQPPHMSTPHPKNFSYASYPLQRADIGSFSHASPSAYGIRSNSSTANANYPTVHSFAASTNAEFFHPSCVPQSLIHSHCHGGSMQPALASSPAHPHLNAHDNGVSFRTTIGNPVRETLRPQTQATPLAVHSSASVPITNNANTLAKHVDGVPPPANSSTTQFPCVWPSNRFPPCDAWITGDQRSVTQHLRERHEFTGGCEMKPCLWGDCDAHMQGRNIPRHIVSCHFAVKAPCQFCGIPLSREDAKKKHGRACAAGREGEAGSG